MNTVLRLLLLAAILPSVAPSLAAADQNSFQVVAKGKDGKPKSGVTLAVLSGGNKFSVGVTDDNGQQSVPLSAGNIPAGTQMKTVVRKCRREDGSETTEIFFLPADARVPPQKNCNDHVAGDFPWPANGGAVVNVNVDRGTPAAANAAAPRPFAPSPKPLFWGQIGVGIGVGAPNSLNDCEPFNQEFLTSPCTATRHAFTFDVGGQLGITPFFAAGGEYFRIGSFDRKGTTPTFLEQSSGQTQFGSFMGRGIIPIGPVSLFGEGGVAVWRTNLTEHQTVGSSTTPITTKLTVNGVSPAFGVGTDVRLSKHFGFGAHYIYFEQQKAVDTHYHVGVAEFNWRF
jgi:hypothetical protein